jgi:sugar/nucleoside kinase (ribokinase family)
MKICSIGGITQDIFLWYKATEKIRASTLPSSENSCLAIPFGEKIDLENIAYFLGGGAANTAVNFSQLGHDAILVASCGNDVTGTFIHDELKKHTINTEHLIINPHTSSGTSYILYNQCHDRIIFVHRGANSAIHPTSFPMQSIENADGIYLTSMRQNEQLLTKIVNHAHTKKIPIAINPGSTQLSIGAQELCASLHAISILILNRSEAATLLKAMQTDGNTFIINDTDTKTCSTKTTLFSTLLDPDDSTTTINDFFKIMLKLGPEIVIITDGPCGVYGATKTDLWHHQALPVTVIDTVGAGDAFGSTFVAIYWHNKNIVHALKGGMYQSASVIQKMGAHAGLLKKEALHQALETMPDELITHQAWSLD